MLVSIKLENTQVVHAENAMTILSVARRNEGSKRKKKRRERLRVRHGVAGREQKGWLCKKNLTRVGKGVRFLIKMTYSLSN